MIDDENSHFETQSLELQIQEAKRRAIEFSHSLREARAQEAKALCDLQLERQKWIASLEENNNYNTINNNLRNGKIFATETINSNQIDVNTGEYISSSAGVVNGAVSSTFVWNQLLNQYKEDILQLRSEHSILKTSHSKLVEERNELMRALKDEQAKSQFRILQITEYEDEKNNRIKKEEQIASENVKLKQELAHSKDLIASLQIELRISAEQKQSLQKLAAEREVNRSSLRNSSEAEYMKYEKRIQEREELLRSYQAELRNAQEQARHLGSQLRDTLQQRDDYQSQQSTSKEAQHRLEQQIQRLLLDVQQLRDSSAHRRTDTPQLLPSQNLSGSPSGERNSFKNKQSKNIQAASPQSYMASSLESNMSGITGKVLVFPDQMKNNSESNLFKLVEQFNQLPGGDSVIYPSDYDNQSHHNPNIAVANNNSDRIDASLAEQYYRYNLQLAETHPSHLPPQSSVAAGGPMYRIQPFDNKQLAYDSINDQLLGSSNLGGTARPLLERNASSAMPAEKGSEDRRKKNTITIPNAVNNQHEIKSSRKADSKKHSAGQMQGSHIDHNLSRNSLFIVPRVGSNRAVSPTYTPTTIPSGQRHYRSIAIAGTNIQRRETPPRGRRAHTDSNHYLESDSISKNADKRTSSGSQRKGTTSKSNNNETDSITYTSQNNEKKSGKKKRSSSAPSKASIRT